MTPITDIAGDTRQGPVIGCESGSIAAFKAIPFARPGRFQAPVPLPSWTEPLDCRSSGPVAAQLVGGVLMGGEDCLSLSVWTPEPTGTKLPVLFWIHGGAFLAGSSSDFDGASLAANGPIVVVAVNYRLGPLGFLQLDRFGGKLAQANNLAMQDLLAALDWVQANIAAFGGDPARVTLCGQSAGCTMTTALMTLPAAQGKFAGAIGLSGPGGSVGSATRAADVADRFLAALGLSPDKAEALIDLPLLALVQAGERVAADFCDPALPGGMFGPVLDGELVPHQPEAALRAGAMRHRPLWLASCRDEMTMFMRGSPPATLLQETELMLRHRFGDAGYDRLLAAHATAPGGARQSLLSEGMWHRPMKLLAAAQHAAGGKIWVSRFDHAPALAPFTEAGPTHGADNACLWAHIPNFIERPVIGRAGGKMALAGIEVTARFQAAILHFGIQGVPEPGTIWPGYTGAMSDIALFGNADRLAFAADDAIEETWRDLERE